MKIIFTGAQGTGKTTVLNYFEDSGHNVITEVVRKLSKEGVNINEQGDIEGQHKIFDTYADIFEKNNDYISDRGLTDVVAYTMYLAQQNGGDDYLSLLKEQINRLVDFHKDNDDVIYFYFPIEFPIEDDGVRSTSDTFRENIDRNIQDCLNQLGVNYHVVKGSVEERINFIKNNIPT